MLNPPTELPLASDRFVFYVSWVNNDNEVCHLTPNIFLKRKYIGKYFTYLKGL